MSTIETNFKKREHNRTTKLEEFEIDKIIKSIEIENSLLLSSGIIQLYLSDENEKWIKYGIGLICLIKNYTEKKYSIRLIDLVPNKLWEEDINLEINYTKLTDHFHYFYGRKGFVGLNFSFEEEANKFHKSIKKTMIRIDKFVNTITEDNIPITIKSTPCPNISSNLENSANISYNTSINNTSSTSKNNSLSFINNIMNKAEKRKIDKISIGNPIKNSFVHLNHIGLTKDNSFDIKMHEKNDKFSTMIMDVLQELNIKPTKHSLDYAKNFIQSNGGYQEYYKALTNKKKTLLIDKTSLDKKKNLIENSVLSDKINPIINDDKNNVKESDSQQSNNHSLTPNSLKVPTRPPPKPPAPKRNYLEVNSNLAINNNAKLESTFINSPNKNDSLSFISPISNINQSQSQMQSASSVPSFSISPSGVLVPPPPPPLPATLPSSSTIELNLSNNSSYNLSSSQIFNSSIDNRSALLKSIENFKGGLKHVDHQNSSKFSNEITENGCVCASADNNNNHANNNHNNDIVNQLFNALNNMRQYLNISSDESNDSDDSFETS